ncbi:MAG: hypothetical protein Q9204_007726, partial [Flavoplaca sp. TL-2023a]
GLEYWAEEQYEEEYDEEYAGESDEEYYEGYEEDRERFYEDSREGTEDAVEIPADRAPTPLFRNSRTRPHRYRPWLMPYPTTLSERGKLEARDCTGASARE